MRRSKWIKIWTVIMSVLIAIELIILGFVLYFAGVIIYNLNRALDMNSDVIMENPSSPSMVPSTSTPLSPVSEPDYTEDDLFCMAAAIYNEAGGHACSDDTRRLVGYVILNRVNDPRFPNTIRQVLEAPNQYGRFSVTGIKFASRSNYAYEQIAVERAYKIAQEVLSVETIPIPDTVVFQAEFKQGVSVYAYQDGLYFCHGKEVN